MQFKDAVSHFLEYLKLVKRASKHTLRSYSTDLQNFSIFTGATLAIDTVTKKSIRQYLAYLYDKKSSIQTVLRHLSSLRSLYRFALKEKWVIESPLEEIKGPKKDKKLPIFISYPEVEHLFNQPDCQTVLGLRDRAIMELLYSSGLRLSEIAGLNIGDLNKAELCITVFGKGKKQRITPITTTAMNWITRYLEHPARIANNYEAVFLNRLGMRLTDRSIDRNFAVYLKKSGLSEHITPHIIRHTIATHWLENGMNLKMIQLLLGHTSLATTTIYTHVSPKLKRAVYDKTHPRAN